MQFITQVSITFLVFIGITVGNEIFTEELLLKPLYTEHLYAHFQFSSRWAKNNDGQPVRHTKTFPRVLAELSDRFGVEELHVSLTGGLWKYEDWGYPVVDAAPGAEVWAWFKSSVTDVDKNWYELTNFLSGLLCASFNFVDKTNSIKPKFTFQPRGVRDSLNISREFVRYSSLPREIVCTENLTPWKKLLPCDSTSGLASLLNSGYIHNARYNSLALQLRTVCRNEKCLKTDLELQQSISLVYDYTILGSSTWSLKKLFGQGVINSCPLVNSSIIFVDITSNASKSYQVLPEADEYLTSSRGGFVSTFAKYNVKNNPLTIYAVQSEIKHVPLQYPTVLYAHQYVIGYGKECGGIVTKIHNNHWADLNAIVLQIFPWYVPVYLHTMTINVNGKKTEPLERVFVPGRQRARSYHLETVLSLPPKSVAIVSIDFDYAFLKWQEYPPDASLGFYVGSAVVSCNLPLARNYTAIPQDGATIADSFNASRSGYLVQVRTEGMILTLPTPDFSMPYNVICLACTVVALAFGPMHNITTKRLILKVKESRNLLQKVKDKVRSLIKKKEENNE